MARSYYTYPAALAAQCGVPADVGEAHPKATPAVVEMAAGQEASEGRVLQEGRALPGRFACFKRLYESRDRKLCVFEDARGHLAAVKTSRLA